MTTNRDCFISVDVETAGPIPGEYSMLSVGACMVGRRDESFYAELKPINGNAVTEALKVTGFDLVELGRTGERPEDAMAKFRDWLAGACPGGKSVFVGFNAGFDWSFVNWYFHRFLGDNPFGFAPLDIKSYYMGLTACAWEDTKSSRICAEFQPLKAREHNALNDARAQAEMFEKMLAAVRMGS
jgi:DNA polymerase III epsilon subunit-like protein